MVEMADIEARWSGSENAQNSVPEKPAQKNSEESEKIEKIEKKSGKKSELGISRFLVGVLLIFFGFLLFLDLTKILELKIGVLDVSLWISLAVIFLGYLLLDWKSSVSRFFGWILAILVLGMTLGLVAFQRFGPRATVEMEQVFVLLREDFVEKKRVSIDSVLPEFRAELVTGSDVALEFVGESEILLDEELDGFSFAEKSQSNLLLPMRAERELRGAPDLIQNFRHRFLLGEQEFRVNFEEDFEVASLALGQKNRIFVGGESSGKLDFEFANGWHDTEIVLPRGAGFLVEAQQVAGEILVERSEQADGSFAGGNLTVPVWLGKTLRSENFDAAEQKIRVKTQSLWGNLKIRFE